MPKKCTPPNILWTLFYTNFLLSCCTFGGGFVIISLFREKYVEKHSFISEEEMLDITAIAQSSPGPVAVNASIILGYRMKGLEGALCSALGTSLPPLFVITALSYCYDAFRTNPIISIGLQVMRAGVAAVILDVSLSLAQNLIKQRKIYPIVLLILALVLVLFFSIKAVQLILLYLTAGIFYTIYQVYKEQKNT